MSTVVVASGSGGVAVRTLRALGDDGTGEEVTKITSRNQVRVCTYFFKGNLVCLRRYMDENNWIEEKDNLPGRCVFIWFGNHVNQYSKCGVIGENLCSRHQRSSRFDGMRFLAYKVPSQIHLERLRSLFPEAMPHHPKGWCLPTDAESFAAVLKRGAKLPPNERPTYIVKPSETAQGSGIFLVQHPDQLPTGFLESTIYKRAYVVQEYVANAMLLDGFKFDLRMYVLVLSVDPLRVYLAREGMARLCSEPYQLPEESNLKNVYQHMTNYSLNKKNANFVMAGTSSASTSTSAPAVAVEAAVAVAGGSRSLVPTIGENNVCAGEGGEAAVVGDVGIPGGGFGYSSSSSPLGHRSSLDSRGSRGSRGGGDDGGSVHSRGSGGSTNGDGLRPSYGLLAASLKSVCASPAAAAATAAANANTNAAVTSPTPRKSLVSRRHSFAGGQSGASADAAAKTLRPATEPLTAASSPQGLDEGAVVVSGALGSRHNSFMGKEGLRRESVVGGGGSKASSNSSDDEDSREASDEEDKAQGEQADVVEVKEYQLGDELSPLPSAAATPSGGGGNPTGLRFSSFTFDDDEIAASPGSSANALAGSGSGGGGGGGRQQRPGGAPGGALGGLGGASGLRGGVRRPSYGAAARWKTKNKSAGVAASNAEPFTPPPPLASKLAALATGNLVVGGTLRTASSASLSSSSGSLTPTPVPGQAAPGLLLLFVNHFASPKDLIPFAGLFPTIASKLFQGKPFKDRKEVYACLEDGEKPRLKKHDKLLCFAGPGSTEESKVTLKLAAAAAAAAAAAITSQEAGSKSGGGVAGGGGGGGAVHLARVKSLDERRGGGGGGGGCRGCGRTPVGPEPLTPTALSRSRSPLSPTLTTARRSTSHNALSSLSGAGGAGSRATAGHGSSGSSHCGTKGSGWAGGAGAAGCAEGGGGGDGGGAAADKEEHDFEDTGVEDGDGPPGMKRRLGDVLPQLRKEFGLRESVFWERCLDLTATTMIAFQPTLAHMYRSSFPKAKRMGADGRDEVEDSDSGSDEEDEEEEDDDEYESVKAAASSFSKDGKKKRRKSSKGGRGKAGTRQQQLLRGSMDLLRPKTLLDCPAAKSEDGDDSFRCFHLMGFDVLLDENGMPHLLEVNSNPSLNINHEYVDEATGRQVCEVSPVDEAIKMAVLRDALNLTQHKGSLPLDSDASLGTWIPCVTREREGTLAYLMVLDKVRKMFTHCQGLRLGTVSGVTATAFQRVARKLTVQAAIADLVFVKIATAALHASSHASSGAGSSSSGASHSVATKVDHLDLELFTEAVSELCLVDGDNSFAERMDLRPEDRAALLEAAVDAYFTPDDDDDDDGDADY